MRTFYTKANGAIKCKRSENGFSLVTSYGNYHLTSHFTNLDDLAEHLYYTAADETDTILSIKESLEKALMEAA